MKIFQVGSDELNFAGDIDETRFHWVVYEYTQDGYEGWGEAVFLGKDGLIYSANLGHCSCYGPTEDLGGMGTMTVEEFLRPKDSIHDYDCKDAVKVKVRELLAESN